MKNVIVIILLFSCKAFSQESVISPRIGHIIDTVERRYFSLFPKIENYDSAECFQNEKDGMDIIIHYKKSGEQRGTDSVFSLNSKTVRELRKYIESYELIAVENITIDWPLILRLVRTSQIPEPYTTKYSRFISRTKGVMKGQILLANDSSLVLWKSKKIYHWADEDTNLVFIPFSDLISVSIEKKSQSGKGILYGLGAAMVIASIGAITSNASEDDFIINSKDEGFLFLFTITALPAATLGGLIGLGAGIDEQAKIDNDINKYYKILPQLKNMALFKNNIPPELMRFH